MRLLQSMAQRVSNMLTFANATRCSLVFALILFSQRISVSSEPADRLSPDRFSSVVALEPFLSEIFVSPTPSPCDGSPSDSLPPQINRSSRHEMFASHNPIERWRKALATVIGINQILSPLFDASIMALRTQKNEYTFDPPIIAPERLLTPIREVRGEPSVRSLLKSRRQHATY